VQPAVWLSFRIPPGFRDVGHLFAPRGIDVSDKTVRRRAMKFGLGCSPNQVRPDKRPSCRAVAIDLDTKLLVTLKPTAILSNH